ncbi:MAG: hypothetical protein ACE5FD_02915 [Anaerolineae bacterium]
MSDHDSPDEGLQKLFQDVDQATETAPTPPRQSRSAEGRSRRSGRTYRSALNESQTGRRKAAKATGKKTIIAGQYIRRSFTFRPDQLDSIERLAGVLGLSQNDLIRWFTDMGIEAVDLGERPPVAEEVRHRYDPSGE